MVPVDTLVVAIRVGSNFNHVCLSVSLFKL